LKVPRCILSRFAGVRKREPAGEILSALCEGSVLTNLAGVSAAGEYLISQHTYDRIVPREVLLQHFILVEQQTRAPSDLTSMIHRPIIQVLIVRP
jgi:hypothetical protein